MTDEMINSGFTVLEGGNYFWFETKDDMFSYFSEELLKWDSERKIYVHLDDFLAANEIPDGY